MFFLCPCTKSSETGWVESDLHLPVFQNKTGQITASANECWTSSAVPAPLALEYELSSFCQYEICSMGCIGQNLMCLSNYLLTRAALSCAFSSLALLRGGHTLYHGYWFYLLHTYIPAMKSDFCIPDQ